MQQTPVHERHNHDLLGLIPLGALRLVEIGCSSGALAREFKLLSPACHYVGIEIDEQFTVLAERYCDECLTLDIEVAPDAFWQTCADADCWIFGDTLEHLRNPWAVLQRIRATMPKNGVVVACIPNAQHWSLQAKLSIGDFRYEASGLLDKTHLRWFTRQTIIELFEQTGFRIETGTSRIFDEPGRERFLPIIEKMAQTAGVDPKIALADALPLQYVVRAVPK